MTYEVIVFLHIYKPRNRWHHTLNYANSRMAQKTQNHRCKSCRAQNFNRDCTGDHISHRAAASGAVVTSSLDGADYFADVFLITANVRGVFDDGIIFALVIVFEKLIF